MKSLFLAFLFCFFALFSYSQTKKNTYDCIYSKYLDVNTVGVKKNISCYDLKLLFIKNDKIFIKGDTFPLINETIYVLDSIASNDNRSIYNYRTLSAFYFWDNQLSSYIRADGYDNEDNCYYVCANIIQTKFIWDIDSVCSVRIFYENQKKIFFKTTLFKTEYIPFNDKPMQASYFNFNEILSFSDFKYKNLKEYDIVSEKIKSLMWDTDWRYLHDGEDFTYKNHFTKTLSIKDINVINIDVDYIYMSGIICHDNKIVIKVPIKFNISDTFGRYLRNADICLDKIIMNNYEFRHDDVYKITYCDKKFCHPNPSNLIETIEKISTKILGFVVSDENGNITYENKIDKKTLKSIYGKKIQLPFNIIFYPTTEIRAKEIIEKLKNSMKEHIVIFPRRQ